ncbi:hypothetical protein [Rhizomonospora bruguierae]|uniref:hypothetical protein n=1 Tax=Rhizomonospora bruguierae TaxID=1581705 RepID=UPI001BCDE5D0|nr:hypothetical protein [Micromonospora sp. NBRC 107566]
MADPMRVALATFGTEEFAALHTACVAAGHEPVAYVHCRSMKPRGRVDARLVGGGHVYGVAVAHTPKPAILPNCLHKTLTRTTNRAL